MLTPFLTHGPYGNRWQARIWPVGYSLPAFSLGDSGEERQGVAGLITRGLPMNVLVLNLTGKAALLEHVHVTVSPSCKDTGKLHCP